MMPKGEIVLNSIDMNFCSIYMSYANKCFCPYLYMCMELKWKVYEHKRNISKSSLNYMNHMIDWLLHFFLIFLFVIDYKIHKLRERYS